MSNPIPTLSLLLCINRTEDGAWTIRCGEAIGRIVPNGDRYGATELKMPRAGFRIQRKLVEAACVTLVDEKFIGELS
jgi:hypothetical protein